MRGRDCDAIFLEIKHEIMYIDVLPAYSVL